MGSEIGPAIVGVDPGKAGGIVTIAAATGELVDARVMPATVLEVVDLLKGVLTWCDGLHVWLEAAQSMPKQGIASAFNYGTHYGELRGVLAALKLRHTLVRPVTWAKVLHAGTKASTPKARSLEAAQRLQPGERWLATARSSKPHEGLVDAYLIAEYGRRQGVPVAMAGGARDAGL